MAYNIENSIDIYDYLAYSNYYKDTVVFSQSEYKSFMKKMNSTLRKLNLRMFRNRIYYNKCLLSSYIPIINAVMEITFPDGKEYTIFNFSMYLIKPVNITEEIRISEKGNIKRIKGDEAEGKVYEYHFIPAVEQNEYKLVVGDGIKTSITKLNDNLSEHNVVKQFPKEINPEIDELIYIDSDYLVKVFKKTATIKEILEEKISEDDFRKNLAYTTFGIKKSIPAFKFSGQDFAEFLMKLKDAFKGEYRRFEINSYSGWRKSENVYKYFPDNKISEIKSFLQREMQQSSLVYEDQLIEMSGYPEKYADMEFEENKNFDYSFMSNLNNGEIFLFSSVLYSVTKHFYKLANVHDNASFAIYLYDNSMENVDKLIEKVKLWIPVVRENINCYPLDKARKTIDIYWHDFSLVAHYSYRIKYLNKRTSWEQKQIDFLCDLDSMPIIVSNYISNPNIRNVILVENERDASSYEHNSIVHLYLSFIDALSQQDEKELLKKLKSYYRTARKQLQNGVIADQEQIERLSYLLASLYAFEDMVKLTPDILIDKAIEVFKSSVSAPAIRDFENEDEILKTFKVFIKKMESNKRFSNTRITRAKVDKKEQKDILNKNIIGWHSDNCLLLDYTNYFELFEEFAKARKYNMNYSKNKLQRLLGKYKIAIPESKSKVPKFQCKRIIVSGCERKAVLRINLEKLNAI